MEKLAAEQNTINEAPWYILGAGAIGCLWACYLSLAGLPVVLITREQRNASKIQLTRQDQQQDITIEQISSHTLSHSSIIVERLLVATKAQQTLAALDAIEPHISKDATLLILQNGMASKDVAQRLSTQKIHIAITTDGAYRTAPLSVVHAGVGQTSIGGQADSEELLSLLPTQFLTIKACDNITEIQWQKLAINCAINGLTAVFQCRNGELLTNPQALARVKALCDEITSITKQIDSSLTISNNLFQQTQKTLQQTANNYSSMYQDIQQGNLTEIDFINGYLCSEARRLGIDCPENQRLVTEIKTIEKTL